MNNFNGFTNNPNDISFQMFQQRIYSINQMIIAQNLQQFYKNYRFFCYKHNFDLMDPISFNLFISYVNNNMNMNMNYMNINNMNNINTSMIQPRVNMGMNIPFPINNNPQLQQRNYINSNEPFDILPRSESYLYLKQQNLNNNINNQNFNIDNNYNYDDGPSLINVIFQTSTGDKRTITVQSDKTISYLVDCYIKNLHLPPGTSVERINFFFNGKMLNGKSNDKIINQLKDFNKITVFDSMDVTGA